MTLFLFLCTNAMAEYRVYQYLIKNRDTYQEKDISYQELSTLNPVAYVAYHGGGETIKVDLLRTWICPGYTGKKQEFCPSPYEELQKQQQETVQ